MGDRTEITKVSVGSIVESVVIGGDLSKLSPDQRVSYYRSVCESIGLNPLTKPFEYITLNGKLTLYARKDAADQLRKRDGVSVSKLDQQIVNDICIVTAYVSAGSRTDASTGAVSVKGLTGEALANAIMKAETKAKRRATLSICGLGMLDETEAETIPTAKQTLVDTETGEILEDKPKPVKIEVINPELKPTMTAEQALSDLGFDTPKSEGGDPFSGVCTSEGVPYSELSLADLSSRFNSLNKSKAKTPAEFTPEQQRKLDSAKHYIDILRAKAA